MFHEYSLRVTWYLRATLDSICNSCNVLLIVEEYAADHDVWAKDFLNTFQKMQVNEEF